MKFIDIDYLNRKDENFLCLLYYCRTCKKLSASRMEVDRFKSISKQKRRLVPITEKYCCRCEKKLNKGQFIYHEPNVCDRLSAQHFLTKDNNLYVIK